MAPAAGEPRQALTVHEAIAAAQDALEELGGLWIEGEVFEYRGPYRGSGHYYFKVRDEDAQLDVKMWAGVARRALRCELAEGQKVLAHGRFDIWPKRGNLSFILDQVEDAGAGDLARRFEALKQRLREQGLFDAARKRPLPRRPRTVALITAHPSAAAADVLRTLEERAAPLTVWLRPARVQGAAAVPDLVEALAEASRARPDLVLLARGGGSLEDLWAFNEEAVVRAVADCPVPVMNAVGHESDFTLCDFAADERAKTPTAAAVDLCQGWLDARQRVAGLAAGLEGAAAGELEHRARQLRELRLLLREQRPSRRVDRLRDRLGQLHAELVLAGERRVERLRLRLERAGRSLAGRSPAVRAGLERQRLAGLGARLEAGSPTALLQRGYALVERPGLPGFLRRAADAPLGAAIRVQLAEGALDARVEGHEGDADSGGLAAADGRE